VDVNWPLLMIAIPTLCYAGTAVAYGVQRDWPSAVIFTGYALANTGFLAIELAKP
jgi:hypothetical protein